MFINWLLNLLSGGESQPSNRSEWTTRPQLECLEGREMPAGLNFAAVVLPPQTSTAPAMVSYQAQATQSLGQEMAKYLNGQVNKRVGGGECAHIATEALRKVGADFTRTETSGTLDYVWTTNRIARLTHGNQLAGKQFKVGEIIQYHNATFSSGGSGKLAHHTQVVAAVDKSGRITHVYEQNYNGIRKVQVNPIRDLTKLTGGSVSIYRAVARTPQAGTWEFTVVNNTNSSRTVTMQNGNNKSEFTLTKADTGSSYTTRSAWNTSKVAPTLKVGNMSVTVQDGAAYELYTLSNGQVGIRKI